MIAIAGRGIGFQRCKASSPEEFWSFSVLFLKVVDARYELWVNDFDDKEGLIEDFGPSLRSKIKSRVKGWQKKREDKLFGIKAPPSDFFALN